MMRQVQEKLHSDESPGSARWLARMERKYGGYTSGVPRHRVSPKDRRSEKELKKGGMIGGDRMSSVHCGYGIYYSRYLKSKIASQSDLTLVEVGILRGIGLAVWSDLFHAGRIIGLDIDLEHALANMQNLRDLGAFSNENCELHEFDQLVENQERMAEILADDRVDIIIDDGLHSIDSIITTMKSVRPYLAKDFVYFVEDNREVHRDIREAFPDFLVRNHGMFTMVSRK